MARITIPPVAKAQGKETHKVMGPHVEPAKVKSKALPSRRELREKL